MSASWNRTLFCIHCRIYPQETCVLVEDNKYVNRSQNSFKNYYTLGIKDNQSKKKKWGIQWSAEAAQGKPLTNRKPFHRHEKKENMEELTYVKIKRF